MKKLLLTVVLLSIYLSAQSQNNLFFYERDKKVYLTPITNKFLVEFTDNEDKTILENNNLTHAKVFKKIYEVEGDLLQIQSAGQGIYSVNQLYSIQGDTEPLYTRNLIVLSWKDETTESEKNDLIEQYGLVYEWSNRLFETYKVNSSLLVSQMIYETNLVKYCHPGFIENYEPCEYIPNDTYFTHQFYLHNTGQTLNDGNTGMADADIDAPEAWDITTGSSDIVVAVIDQGVTSNHPDLPNSRQLRLPLSDFSEGMEEEDRDDDPSPENGENHGNACAGIIAAQMDNNEGVVGVAPNCIIMPIRISLSANTSPETFGAAITFAVDNGANVINCSWGKATTVNTNSPLAHAIEDALDNNVVVVFASGNDANHANGNDGFIRFPASLNEEFPNLIVVGASDRYDEQANYSPTSNNSPGIINIVAPSHTAYYDEESNEDEDRNIWTIDIPGNDGLNPYPSTNSLTPVGGELPSAQSGVNHLAYTGRFGSTSAAAPQVAGVVALMLSVNPCLSVEQVNEVLYSTTDKIGNNITYEGSPSISPELGHGRLNAYNAVNLAQSLYVDGLDLFTRDVPEDLGLEPNIEAENLWESEDIWVFNYENYGLEDGLHHNPTALEENFVFVKVRNKGCSTTNGDEVVKLYWAKASTALTWPSYWDGSITNPLMGDEIGTQPIGTLEPGEETIIIFTWIPPDPTNYEDINNAPQHFCLLSRIVTASDPMTNETINIPWNLGPNVRENNNIAWRNLSIVPLDGVIGGTWEDDQLAGATVHVGNATVEVNTFDIAFGPPKSYSGNSVFDEAEIIVSFDETTWNKWLAGGKQKENIQISKQHRRQVIIKGENAKLKNLKFDPHERGLMNVSFNFLTKRLSSKKEFKYHVKQSISSTDEVIGGETYHIKLPTRTSFSADAGGDIQISPNSSIQLNASDIYEDAIYNWYAPDGTLIQSGRDISIPTDSTRKYKLEVIATSDGFKDYDEVEVRVKPAEIISIIPNPASNTTVVEYDAQQVNSAYLMVSMPFSASTDIFPLDITQNTYNLNVSQYQTGVYGILLVVDGQIVDQKGLIVE